MLKTNELTRLETGVKRELELDEPFSTEAVYLRVTFPPCLEFHQDAEASGVSPALPLARTPLQD